MVSQLHWEGERGILENRGKFVRCCVLVTVYQLRHPQVLGHTRNTFKSITLSSAFLVLGSTYCLLLYLTEVNDFTKHKSQYGLNNLKLDGSHSERRGQVPSVPCFIYTLRTSIRYFKLQSLTARFEAIMSVLPNCVTCTRLTFSAPQIVICLVCFQRHHFLFNMLPMEIYFLPLE